MRTPIVAAAEREDTVGGQTGGRICFYVEELITAGCMWGFGANEK